MRFGVPMESNFAEDQEHIAGVLKAMLDGTQPPISFLEAKQMCFRDGRMRLCKAASLQIGALTHAVLSEAFSALGEEEGRGKCPSSTLALEHILSAYLRCEDFVGKASAVLGPANRSVRFRDCVMGSFDRAFRRVLHRVLHCHSEALARCLGDALLAGGSGSISALIGHLRALGLARGLLLKLRNVLASQDYEVASARRDDFSFVCEYLSAQRAVYLRGFYTQIERGVLQRLYSDYDVTSLVRVLRSLESLRSVYVCFSRAGLLETLLRAHQSILLNSGTGNIHEMFCSRRVDCAVRRHFKDPRFREASDTFYSGLAEDPRTISAVVAYVSARGTGSGGVKAATDETDAFVVFIVENARSPGALLDSLRIALGNRLLLGTADLGSERSFLVLLKRSHAEKMLCMIDDTERAKDGRPLLMRMCMWPCYEGQDDGTGEDERVSASKAEITAELGAVTKRVQWFDALSRARVSIGGVLFTMTLFQYSLLVKVAKGGVSPSAVACCGTQGEKLLSSGLVFERNGSLHLRPVEEACGVPTSLLPEGFALRGTEHSEGGVMDQGCSHAVAQAQIARAMKARKTLPLSELCVLVPGADEHVAVLVDKGLLEVSEETVRYVV